MGMVCMGSSRVYFSVRICCLIVVFLGLFWDYPLGGLILRIVWDLQQVIENGLPVLGSSHLYK